MRTKRFRDVVYGAARLCGMAPDTGDLSSEEAEALVEYANARVRQGVEWHWWSELMRYEQRQYRADWDASATYAEGDECYHDDEYWVALQASTNEEPADGSAYWETQDELDRYIELAQAGETEIGTVRAVTMKNPKTTRIPGVVNFWLSENGIQVSDLAPNQPWVEFRIRPPEFTWEVYSSSTSYVEGDLCYRATTGECYRCLFPVSGSDPATDTTNWQVVEFPWVLAGFVVRGAYADWLRRQGQTDKAIVEEDRALGELVTARDVEEGQQAQHSAMRFAVI